MANYLVTGGCGFIGSVLTKQLLTQGHQVTVVDDLSNGQVIYPEATFIQADIAEYDEISSLFVGLDGCFHLAAIPRVNMNLEQWDRDHAINLQGSLNVFKAAIAAHKIPVVYASSCAVYGDSKRFPLTEGQALRPPSAYGCDKLASEQNAYFLAQQFQLPSIGLRLFNVYGPNQRPDSPYSGVITQFMTHLRRDEPMIIFGDGTQTRDFVFVEDVVAAMMRAMNNLMHGAQVVNICSGMPITMNQLARLLADLLGKKCDINYHPKRLLDAKNSYGSIYKMHRQGFVLQYDLQQGLLKMIQNGNLTG